MPLKKLLQNWGRDNKFAVFSLLAIGATWWIIIFSTTFLSFLLWGANTLHFQAFIANKVSNYLTRETGIDISFESAIIPRWRKGKLRLQNVVIKRSAEKANAVNGIIIDLTIQSLDVKLSFWQWFEGKGPIKQLTLTGVRGKLDRRQVDFSKTGSSYKAKRKTDLFEIESLKMSDVYIMLYQQRPKRVFPIPVSIYQFECKHLRRAWLLHDLFLAQILYGSIENCLFKLGEPLDAKDDGNNDVIRRRLKLQGLSIDHLAENSTGPVSWLSRGVIDIIMEFELPLNTMPISGKELGNRNVKFKFDINLRNISTHIPVQASHLHYLPIEYYLNHNYLDLPLHFDFKISHKAFHGAWYLNDIGFWTHLSCAAGDEIALQARKIKTKENLSTILAQLPERIAKGIVHLWKYGAKKV